MKGTLRKSNFYAVLLAVLLVISTIPVTAQNVFAGTTLVECIALIQRVKS